MKEYVSFIDGLPYIVKIILALPGFDGIFYGIYRIAKGKLIIGILWIVLGFAILWIIDLISVILNGKVTFLT
ncbi:MAG: hypothetical protein JXR48_09390 [Candidatus Delongbacteria bacterium]|jgi:hypothetical protein|nr:hypothetical protein [Candidatus Delongbacteria bacterium]